MRTCSVDGCSSKHYGLSYCKAHYVRNRVHGNVDVNKRTERAPVEERFWTKVQKTETCWLWTGAKGQHGYGHICSGGKRGKFFTASRLSWEMANGSIPDGLDVLHKCDNPACVNPSHLFLGTHTDNMRDMWAKGRGKCLGAGRRGSENGNHRLTEEQVAEIVKRSSEGATRRGLARKFGVSRTLIYLIANQAVWHHVTRGAK